MRIDFGKGFGALVRLVAVLLVAVMLGAMFSTLATPATKRRPASDGVHAPPGILETGVGALVAAQAGDKDGAFVERGAALEAPPAGAGGQSAKAVPVQPKPPAPRARDVPDKPPNTRPLTPEERKILGHLA